MPQADITKPIDLTYHSEGTGPKRHRLPVYKDFMHICNSACPAGENIQAWMAHAQTGDYYQAIQQIMIYNPFPGVMGRICVKLCENECNRNYIDDTVNIHAMEGYIGDLAVEENWQPKWEATSTGRRIMVVGAGPGGLDQVLASGRNNFNPCT